MHGLLGRACRPCNSGMALQDVHENQGMWEETWCALHLLEKGGNGHNSLAWAKEKVQAKRKQGD